MPPATGEKHLWRLVAGYRHGEPFLHRNRVDVVPHKPPRLHEGPGRTVPLKFQSAATFNEYASTCNNGSKRLACLVAVDGIAVLEGGA